MKLQTLFAVAFALGCTLSFANPPFARGGEPMPLRDAVEHMFAKGLDEYQFLGDKSLSDAFIKAGGPPTPLEVTLKTVTRLPAGGCKKIRMTVQASKVEVPRPGDQKAELKPLAAAMTFNACPSASGIKP